MTTGQMPPMELKLGDLHQHQQPIEVSKFERPILDIESRKSSFFFCAIQLLSLKKLALKRPFQISDVELASELLSQNWRLQLALGVDEVHQV